MEPKKYSTTRYTSVLEVSKKTIFFPSKQVNRWAGWCLVETGKREGSPWESLSLSLLPFFLFVSLSHFSFTEKGKETVGAPANYGGGNA